MYRKINPPFFQARINTIRYSLYCEKSTISCDFTFAAEYLKKFIEECLLKIRM